MTSIRLTHTALAIAVAAALTSGVAAAAEQTMPSVNTDVLTGQSGDTLKTVSHQEYENKGTIKNFGTIHLAIWSTLTNSGNIENIGSFTGESDASRLVNKASGTIHVNSDAFDVSLQNEGNVIVHGDSLSFVDRDLVVKTGSTIAGADGKRLKKISLRNESGERTAAAVEVEEGAVLEADVIEADSGRIGSVVKGKITGDVVNLQGSFINLYATAEIIGRDVTLTQIDQVSPYRWCMCWAFFNASEVFELTGIPYLYRKALGVHKKPSFLEWLAAHRGLWSTWYVYPKGTRFSQPSNCVGLGEIKSILYRHRRSMF